MPLDSWLFKTGHVARLDSSNLETDQGNACVVGDTVGDPFKDTSGPSLDILLKLMSMVALLTAPLIQLKYDRENMIGKLATFSRWVHQADLCWSNLVGDPTK